MSTFRGFTHGLISRVQRTGSHYLDTDTLRFFDAYAGVHAQIDPDHVAVVESVKDWTGNRWYRVTYFIFKLDGTVEIDRVTPRDTMGNDMPGWPTRSKAERALRDYVRKVKTQANAEETKRKHRAPVTATGDAHDTPHYQSRGNTL